MFEELIMVVELDNPQTEAPHNPQMVPVEEVQMVPVEEVQMVPVEEVQPSEEKLAWQKDKEEFMISYNLTDATITQEMKEIMIATIGQEPA